MKDGEKQYQLFNLFFSPIQKEKNLEIKIGIYVNST